MDSSPGIPYCRSATTNKDWLKWDGFNADPIQLQLLWIDVQHVLEGRYHSYYRSFIKMEPHKTSKCEDKRWRLIIASPLSVQLAWHMMFDFMNDREIDYALELPSQQGICLYHGDWKRFYKSWIDQGLTSSLDKAAWDWTAPCWALELDLELRFRLARGRAKEQWYEIARRLYDDAFVSPKIVTTEGIIFQQKHPGIMKSGCVNTISTNSHCQVFLHLAVCMGVNKHNCTDLYEVKEDFLPLPACLGDDTLNSPRHVTTSHIEEYRRYGVQVKTVSDTMEFAGHTFTARGPIPTYRYKHLVRFMYMDPRNLEDYVNAMLRMYAHHDEMYEFWELMAEYLGLEVDWSRAATLFWYDESV